MTKSPTPLIIPHGRWIAMHNRLLVILQIAIHFEREILEATT